MSLGPARVPVTCRPALDMGRFTVELAGQAGVSGVEHMLTARFGPMMRVRISSPDLGCTDAFNRDTDHEVPAKRIGVAVQRLDGEPDRISAFDGGHSGLGEAHTAGKLCLGHAERFPDCAELQ